MNQRGETGRLSRDSVVRASPTKPPKNTSVRHPPSLDRVSARSGSEPVLFAETHSRDLNSTMRASPLGLSPSLLDDSKKGNTPTRTRFRVVSGM